MRWRTLACGGCECRELMISQSDEMITLPLIYLDFCSADGMTGFPLPRACSFTVMMGNSRTASSPVSWHHHFFHTTLDRVGSRGGLQFTLLYLCLGIKHSHRSTNPYVWLSKSQVQMKCFYPWCFTCFPSSMSCPAFGDSPCHCISTFSFQSMPSLHCTYWHLCNILHLYCKLTLSRIFIWSTPLTSPETCTVGLNRCLLWPIAHYEWASLPVIPAGG